MENQNHNVLDDGRIGRLLFKLSLPAFFGMFVITLYNVVDTIFVGRYVGSLGIAGLSVVFPVQMLSMGMGMMTGMGGASVISRLIGAGDKDRAEHVLGNAVTATVILSLVITVTGLVNVDFWLRLMGASETILPYARDYMVVILIGLLFQTFAMALSTLIRAEGNVRVPMIGMILGAVLNIIFCAVFIIWLGMGVRGSGLAATLAQLISVVYFMSYYYSKKNYLQLRLRNLAIQWGIFRDIMAIGVASLAQTLAGSLSAILVNRMLVSYGGDAAISAYGILNRIMMFATMPAMVIGQGLQPIVGFNFGAKRYGRALKAVWLAILWGTICCTLSFLVLYFWPESFLRIFTSEKEIVDLGASAAKLLFLSMALVGFMISGATVFQATGKAAQAFITSISRSAMFLLPAVIVLPRFWGLNGIWLACPVADVLSVILVAVLLIPQIRMFRRLNLSTNDTGVGEAVVVQVEESPR
jgi:putative MATE family efflux protein